MSIGSTQRRRRLDIARPPSRRLCARLGVPRPEFNTVGALKGPAQSPSQKASIFAAKRVQRYAAEMQGARNAHSDKLKGIVLAGAAATLAASSLALAATVR